MATAYPGALDSSTQQPSPSSTTDLDASGYEHDVVHTNHSGAIIALETKLGTGTSNAADASDGQVMTRQSDGTTAWESVPAGVSWSGSTANGLATYGSSSSVVSESTATYDGTTLQLTTSGGGLKMDGLNSSNANTLDDYEEGTFDVTATVASGTLTVDTNRDTLKYTKIGNRVFIMGQIEFTTASTPSGAWSLSGLPFTNTNTGTYSVNKRPNIATGISTPASDIDPGSPFGWIEANTTVITMAVGGIASTATLNANHIDTGTHVFITGQYVCDS
jgi:hypothetical protein